MSSDDRRRHDRDQLANGLRLRREGLGLSRREVADRSGLSYPYVSQLENGDREPSLDALGRLAGALDTTTEELLTAPGLLADAIATPRSAPPTHAAPRRLAAPAPAVAGTAAGAPGAATWHLNPSHQSVRARRSDSPPSGIAAAVDEAYSVLSRLTPAERLDAAGILLARCVRDATPPE